MADHTAPRPAGAALNGRAATAPALGAAKAPALGAITAPALGAAKAPGLGATQAPGLGATQAPGLGATTTVEVKSETPFLPRVAFVLISLASIGGTYLTGRLHGLEGAVLAWRWLQFWGVALATGMLAWRLFYLRGAETGLSPERVGAHHAALLGRVRVLAGYLAPLLLLGAGAALVVPYLAGWNAALLVACSVVMAPLLLLAHRSRAAALGAFVVGVAALAGWGWGDSFGLGAAAVRGVHLLAFAAWLGGALFNLGAAVPAGRRHVNLDAVVAGARQLERFRWVVRVSLPTIIVTGVWMAVRYGGVTSPFWLSGIGLLVPLKLLLIVALVVIFITCPLYRACSPVRGVCNIADLEGGEG